MANTAEIMSSAVICFLKNGDREARNSAIVIMKITDDSNHEYLRYCEMILKVRKGYLHQIIRYGDFMQESVSLVERLKEEWKPAVISPRYLD